ncbi:uncharacterized protein LOC135468152 [Liolophura sinensis]|uniref:uncharacterized protein LOC135468152 n=1 Tax=Liolophura sinensis TaxID=3198878 RepID=UPI00315986D2
MEACHAGIHRPTVAGIHGGEDGAYSIALSGGYEDDIDLGECFTYTGEGGRDLKGTKSNPKNLRTAAQSKDQTLTRGNLALSRNVESGNPVRVIRGYKLRSPFAPEDGYRYDGLYTVEKAWFTVGLSGFGVWKFALRRCENQALPPWNIVQDSQSADSAVSPKASPSGNKDKAAGVSSSSEDAEAELCSSEKTEKPVAVKVEETTEKTDFDSTASNKCPTTPVDSTATETKSESDSGIDSDSGSVGSLHRSNSVISDGSTTSDNQSEDKSDV